MTYKISIKSGALLIIAFSYASAVQASDISCKVSRMVQDRVVQTLTQWGPSIYFNDPKVSLRVTAAPGSSAFRFTSSTLGVDELRPSKQITAVDPAKTLPFTFHQEDQVSASYPYGNQGSVAVECTRMHVSTLSKLNSWDSAHYGIPAGSSNRAPASVESIPPMGGAYSVEGHPEKR